MAENKNQGIRLVRDLTYGMVGVSSARSSSATSEIGCAALSMKGSETGREASTGESFHRDGPAC
ncbi:MAG: hypothetical protein C4293_09215 [Nitrospiraceae bacterium]